MSGSGGTVYTIVLRGDAAAAHERVLSQDWVDAIDVSTSDGASTWQVRVNDDQAAEAKLMRLVSSDEHVAVSEFGRKEMDLEEVFMALVEGERWQLAWRP